MQLIWRLIKTVVLVVLPIFGGYFIQIPLADAVYITWQHILTFGVYHALLNFAIIFTLLSPNSQK